jgi:hypothetical protein
MPPTRRHSARCAPPLATRPPGLRWDDETYQGDATDAAWAVRGGGLGRHRDGRRAWTTSSRSRKSGR